MRVRFLIQLRSHHQSVSKKRLFQPPTEHVVGWRSSCEGSKTARQLRESEEATQTNVVVTINGKLSLLNVFVTQRKHTPTSIQFCCILFGWEFRTACKVCLWKLILTYPCAISQTFESCKVSGYQESSHTYQDTTILKRQFLKQALEMHPVSD